MYLMYGTLSTTVWILLVSSSVLGYHAHHLMDDMPTDLKSDAERTPSISSGVNGVAISLEEIRAHNVGEEGEDMQLSTESGEPSSIGKFKYPNAWRMHARTIARIADYLRWIGKSLAIINAILIVTNSLFQYAGFYNNCYCNSSLYTWGSSAFDVIAPNSSDINLASSAWTGALVLSLTCCAFFVGSIYLVRDSLPA